MRKGEEEGGEKRERGRGRGGGGGVKEVDYRPGNGHPVRKEAREGFLHTDI